MVVTTKNHFHVPFYAAILFLTVVFLTLSVSVKAQEEATEPKAQKETVEAKIFPGRNEVVPQATVISARVAEADVQVRQAEARDAVYQTLDSLVDSLGKVEEQFQKWDEINSWRLNRLLRAQLSYTDLRDQQGKPLGSINTQLFILENLRNTWQNEKTYWQEWQVALGKKEVEVPVETFQRTLISIDTLLNRIDRVGSELVKAQQKYSSGQEVIASRLSMIDKSLDILRLDAFRRNTFSIFEPNFYSQFKLELFTDIKADLAITSSLPTSFLKRHSLAFSLQIVSIFIITLLLIHHRRQGKPIAEKWRFLFQRPLTGAIFITLSATLNFTNIYSKAPFDWAWLLMVFLVIVTMRLPVLFDC